MNTPKQVLAADPTGDRHSAEALEYSNRGARLHLAGDLAGARRDYLRALEADPNHVTAHSNLGFLLTAEGRLDEALGHLRRALEIDPRRSMAWTNLGNLRALEGDHDAAVEALEKALALDPNNAQAGDSLARVRLAAGDLEGAERAWRAALAAAPGEARFLVELGKVVAALDRLPEALSLLGEAVRATPESAPAWATLGSLLFLRRDLGSARDALERAASLAADDPSLPHQLALVAVAVGDQDDAGQQLLRALRIDPEHLPSLLDLAVLEIGAGQFRSALARLDQVLAHAADHRRARHYRAVALDRLGHPEEAEAILRELAEEDDATGQRARDYLAAQGHGEG